MDSAFVQPELGTTGSSRYNRTFFCYHWYNIGYTINEKIRCDTKRQWIITDGILTESIQNFLLLFILKQVAGELTLYCFRVLKKVFNKPLDLAQLRQLRKTRYCFFCHWLFHLEIGVS